MAEVRPASHTFQDISRGINYRVSRSNAQDPVETEHSILNKSNEINNDPIILALNYTVGIILALAASFTLCTLHTSGT